MLSLPKMHIIMHSDEMNETEVRNVEKISIVCRFLYMKFSFRWETTVLFFVVQI